jgi:hypothetical protein
MKRLLLVFAIIQFASWSVDAQKYEYSNSWGKQGFELTQSKPDLIQLVFSIQNFSIDPVIINGQNLKKVSLPGVFLPNRNRTLYCHSPGINPSFENC